MKFTKLPNHVAITLDGNRRWAESQGLERKEGIKYGIQKTEEVMYEWTKRFEKEFGVKPFKELTIHALTLNNMQRPKEELEAITKGFIEAFREARVNKKYENVRVNFGGRKHLLDKMLQMEMHLLEEHTKNFTDYNFNVCIAYDGTDEINRAISLAKYDLDGEKKTNEFMYFPRSSPIDLFIRTSGEKRLSGFMLYYIGYAEIFFLDCYAEDFTYDQFIEVMDEYANKRQRRFGI
jgi:tritrans,polycis-undecaprenyl-diphosphate synthase [geranylgeranyl-diphosphate specific]